MNPELYLGWRRARGAAATALHATLGRAAAGVARLALGRGAAGLPERPERVLALSLQKIGDAVATEPALRLLRKRWPGARIAVAAAASRERGPDMGACEVFRLVAAADEVIPVRRARDVRALAGGSDLVVAFGLRARDAWAALAARGARGVALGYSWRGRGGALDVRLAPPEQVMLTASEARVRGARPQHELWGRLLVDAGLATADDLREAGSPRLVVPEGARRDACALLGERGLAPGQALVLAPWNDQPHYRWPEARWVELARTLLAAGLVASVVVVGGHGRAEVAHATRLVEALRGGGAPATSFAGAFGIDRSAAVLERAALVVAIDSGPAHVARAVGARVVTVFGPGSPAVWGPPGATAVQRTGGCHGCRQPRCFLEGRECLEGLSVATVLEGALAAGRNSSGSAAPGP